MAHIIDGKQLAAALRAETADTVRGLVRRGILPRLAALRVGEDPASQLYVKHKRLACAAVGIDSVEIPLPATTTEDVLLRQIASLNEDPSVHAILIQLPLPAQIDTYRVLAAVALGKDVDGFHPEHVGRLALGLPGPRPCTPLGVMALIRAAGVDPAGRRAVVIGRSTIVGRPTAALLTEANATVTLCHSRTTDLAGIVAEGEIVVAAIGRPRCIRGAWIRPGATVIDVGINRCPDGSVVGDVDFATAAARAGQITPVPGGVGPMTIAMLLRNTVALAEHSL